MEEQRVSAHRRIAEADERFGELSASYEALSLRDASRSAELAALNIELAQKRDEHFSAVAEFTAKLSAEEGVAARNWDDRCRIHAELLEATLSAEHIAKDLDEARQQLAQLESALRQRQEETEQTHKALGDAMRQQAELKGVIAAGEEREAVLIAKLALAEDRMLILSAQRYAALADARSARSQVSRLAVGLQQAREEAHTQLSKARDQIATVQAEAQVTEAKLSVTERIASERSDEIARLNGVLSHRENQTAELELVLSRMQSDLNDHLIEKSGLAEKLAQRQFEVEKHSEWLRRVYATLGSIPFWWRLLHPSWRRRLESRRLLQRGLFDEQIYITRYPEVAAAGLNPLRHYILHGLEEGRQID